MLTPGSPLVSPGFAGCHGTGRSAPAHGRVRRARSAALKRTRHWRRVSVREKRQSKSIRARAMCRNSHTERKTLAHEALRNRGALLPPYTTGIVRIRSNLDIKLGRVIGGWQWRAADRSCAARCGHSSRGASGLGVAFVGALCRRIDSQGIAPRSLNWKIGSPGFAGCPVRPIDASAGFAAGVRRNHFPNPAKLA